MRSRKPEAKRFKKWVTSEVLPTIRKTGRYEAPTSPTINPAQQRLLQDAIAERFQDGKHRPYAWSRFNKHFKLGSYKQLPANMVDEAIVYIGQMPMTGEVSQQAIEQAILDKVKYTRYCLTFAQDGRINLSEVPHDAYIIREVDFAKVIGDPGAMLDRKILPEIITAAASRL